MDSTQHDNLPIPHEIIDNLIKGGYTSKSVYLVARQAVKTWYASIGLPLQQLTVFWEDNVNVTFIDYQLSAEQIQDAANWFADQDNGGQTLVNDLIRDGYRLSFVYDVKHDCVVTSLIGKTGQNPNRNLCMTTRHATVGETLPLLLYKQFVVFENGSWGEAATESLFG